MYYSLQNGHITFLLPVIKLDSGGLQVLPTKGSLMAILNY
jgi:hypothetical protein